MKKFYLFSLLAASVLSLSAADAPRKSWDFTKWSAETVANIKADETNWSSDENGSGTKMMLPDVAYWYTPAGTGAEIEANGTIVSELAGLKVSSPARGLAVALNLPEVTKSTPGSTSDMGSYHGGSYLWLYSKTKDLFTIPRVRVGAQIIVGVESHKTADASGLRGLKFISSNSDVTITPATAESSAYTEFTIQVGEESTQTADSVDITIQATNGCHLYFITVDGGDGPSVQTDPHLVYLYSGELDEDNIYNYGGISEYADVTPVSLEASMGAFAHLGTAEAMLKAACDSLATYDVLIVAPSIVNNEMGQFFLSAVANRVPILSFSPNFGAVEVAPDGETGTIKVAEGQEEHALFADVEIGEDGSIEMFPNEVPGKKMLGFDATGNRFANCDVLATVEGVPSIMTYGSRRNLYMILPIAPENILAGGDLALTPNATTMIANAVAYLSKTKAEVVKASKPSVSYAYSDGQTEVTLSCALFDAAIFYSINEGDSALYTKPLVFTENATLKAYVVAPSYEVSDTLAEAVVVQTQAAAPQIAVANGDGQTTITLTQAENAPIYYSFSGIANPTLSATYSEPIVVTEPGTIYAYSAADGVLTSEMVSKTFEVGGIPAVKDTVAHFTANQTDWYDNAVLHVGEESATVLDAIANANQFGATGAAKAIYYFGKSAWNYYDASKDEEVPVTDENGNQIKCADGVTDSVKVIRYRDDAALKYITSNTDSKWVIKSYGQVITGETSEGPLQGIGNGQAGRYAEQAIDEIGGMPTKGFMDFGGKVDGEPYSQSIESTVAFAAGEYDIVVYVGNGNNNKHVILSLQTSADGENWTSVVDTLNYSLNQRYYKKTRKHVAFSEAQYVRVTQTSGSSKGYVYDIYVISTEGTTGIKAIESNEARVLGTGVVYNILGQKVGEGYKGLVIKNGKKMIVR